MWPVSLVTGAHCEIPLHDCSFYPCQHNGTCNIVDDFTYSCSCPERYEGVNCEVYVPFCRENSCSVDSTCIEEESSYSCACSIGFQGQFCEINIDDCANVSCANGALCVDGVNEFLCACLSGFDGGYCEIDVNECASNPCTNGGTCLDLIDGYLCLCLAGYEGGVCEVDVDECGSMPCINGGSCIDGVNEFRCECGIGKYIQLYAVISHKISGDNLVLFKFCVAVLGNFFRYGYMHTKNCCTYFHLCSNFCLFMLYTGSNYHR